MMWHRNRKQNAETLGDTTPNKNFSSADDVAPNRKQNAEMLSNTTPNKNLSFVATSCDPSSLITAQENPSKPECIFLATS